MDMILEDFNWPLAFEQAWGQRMSSKGMSFSEQSVLLSRQAKQACKEQATFLVACWLALLAETCEPLSQESACRLTDPAYPIDDNRSLEINRYNR